MNQEEMEKLAGKPRYFDFDKYMECVQEMINSDEAIGALTLLKVIPSYYREHKKAFLDGIRDNILSRIATPIEYSNHHLEFYEIAKNYEKEMSIARYKEHGLKSPFQDLGDMINEGFCRPRGPLMLETVKELNAQGITPHIVEFGPAAFWLPHGLKKAGVKFKYKPLTLNAIALHGNMRELRDFIDLDLSQSKFHIFVCFEVIEHMWDDTQLVLDYLKQKVAFDLVCLSTPLHTFDGGTLNLDRDIQHLRTYSRQDFVDYGAKNFPNRAWRHWIDHSQVLMGKLDGRDITLSCFN